MIKGDKIIWNSGFGYEIGYFIEKSDFNMYNTYKVNMISGKITGECMHSKNEIFLYSDELLKQMKKIYKY